MASISPENAAPYCPAQCDTSLAKPAYGGNRCSISRARPRVPQLKRRANHDVIRHFDDPCGGQERQQTFEEPMELGQHTQPGPQYVAVTRLAGLQTSVTSREVLPGKTRTQLVKYGPQIAVRINPSYSAPSLPAQLPLRELAARFREQSSRDLGR